MDQGGLSPIITASALLLLVSLLILSRFITGLLQKKKREAAIAKLAAGFAASLQHEEWLVRGEGFSFSYLIEAVPWWSWKQFSKGRGIGKFLEIAVPCEGQNCLTLRRRQRFSFTR